MTGLAKLLFGRWSDPRHALYLAIVFQAGVFAAVYTGHPYGAAGFAGGTVGCAVASLRLQDRQRQSLQ
jgi:hypothetical protein